MLPKIHGFDVARRVRANPQLENMPIVMLSAVHRGWQMAEDLRSAYGIQHHIEKPFEASQLRAAVRQALGPANSPHEMSPEATQRLQDGIRAYRGGDLDSAQKHLERGLAVDPLAFQIHFQIGLLHGRRGRPFDAISALEQAIQLNPRLFPGVKNLAVLYQKTGFPNKSTEMWERALVLAPDDHAKESIREHLRRLAGHAD
jgi:tetratricopeptide (TPR) repeat protein